jgi:hypothetical protein
MRYESRFVKPTRAQTCAGAEAALAAGRSRLKAGRTLDDGDLAAAFGGYEPLIARDGVECDGRFFSQLLARRKP